MIRYGADVLLTEEQIDLREVANELGTEKLAEPSLEWEESGEVDTDYLQTVLNDAGFLGPTILEQYGGGGGSFLDFIVVLEQIAKSSMPAASLMQATCGGPPMHIVELGSEELKAQVLPKIAQGTADCAVAMTEADAGSDLGRIQTTMRTDGDEVVLNGSKIYVGGGGASDYYITYAREEPGKTTEGLGCILVPKDAPGIEFGRHFKMLGARTVSRREIIFDQCRVPKGYVLAHAGDFRKMIDTFNAERIHNSGFNLGIAQGSYEHAVTYATDRETFGKPLVERQGIQWMFAEILTHIEAARWLVYGAAQLTSIFRAALVVG